MNADDKSGAERCAEAHFRTPREATECLEQLNEEIDCMGSHLKFERPEGYEPLPEGHDAAPGAPNPCG